MPNTRNFSDREKPQALALLNIHDDSKTAPLLTGINRRTRRRWRKKLRRRQNTTLSEKSFSLSDKRTMSAKLLTNQKLLNNLTLTLDASIQPPTNPNAVRNDSHNAYNDGSGEYHLNDNLELASQKPLCLCAESPAWNSGYVLYP